MEIPFSLSYNALKMFGRQLYSNPWAAISELVANGFDAKAQEVYLFIDMTNKEQTTIEIFDNGTGMDQKDLQKKYTIIGRNRRIENINDKAAGRKGIGKLAALYLSDNYTIVTKKDAYKTAWSVNVENMSDETTPCLIQEPIQNINIECSSLWNSAAFSHGTLIQLRNVKLLRIGEAAIEALKHKLSNYFLLDNLDNKLNICIKRSASNDIKFERISKKIAFDNMAAIYHSEGTHVATNSPTFSLPYKNKLKETKSIEFPREEKIFPSTISLPKTEGSFATSGTISISGKKKTYQLAGWIGIHASIDKTEAEKNDPRYVKNQFYNPNQIRVYVRGKLANDIILDKLSLVGAFANYIEGEVSFDILDENDLDDVATANRQDFSTIDDRVKLLITLLKGICHSLIGERKKIGEQLKIKEDKENENIRGREKKVFTQDVFKDLTKQKGISNDQANEVSLIIANKLKGNIELKKSFKLFLSHSKKDRIFTDFIAAYLRQKGFTLDNENLSESEIFYSSDGLNIQNLTPLSALIKQLILEENTQILFVTSSNFLESQYCLFEGGAAWATRAVGDYGIIAVDHKSIPSFLTNGKSEFCFDSNNKDSFMLNEENYKHIVTILNNIIEHLNKNRIIRGKPAIESIPTPVFKDEVQMKEEGKTIKDYMDPIIVRYWTTYIEDKISEYLSD